MRVILALLLLAMPIAASAKPLVVKTGEAWAFRIDKSGDPVKAHKVDRTAKPAKGEIVVSVRAMLGTSLSAVNGTGQGWTFKAELLNAGKASPARSCTLPKSSDPIFEQWPGKTAEAVRISKFVPAKDGNC